MSNESLLEGGSNYEDNDGLVKLGTAFAGLVLAATFLVVAVPARAGADDFDAAGTYKAKCFACHGAKAEKKFDATLSDGELNAGST